MGSFEEETKGARLSSSFENLLKLSEDLVQLLKSDAPRSAVGSNADLSIEYSYAESNAASLADQLREVLQQRTQTTEEAVERINRELNAFLPQLQGSAAGLQSLVDKHSLPDVPQYCEGSPSISRARDIITYAHKLCYTTFAPPGYQAGITNLRHFRPPMPQEWQLRASQLHQYSDQSVLRSVREQDGTASGQGDVEARPLFPGRDMLADLPPMPPGWKPGDPIPGADHPSTSQGDQPLEPKGKKEQHPKLPRPSSSDAAFDFILNPDWEAVEEDFSEDESD